MSQAPTCRFLVADPTSATAVSSIGRSRGELCGRGGSFALSSSVYVAHAKVTRHHLKADLGKFGKISLRYHARSQRQAMTAAASKAPKPGSIAARFFQRLLGCAVLFEPTKGVFKGRIRFRGEGGYTRVRAHRAHGTISPATLECSK